MRTAPDLPEPLVPPGVDIRGMPKFMLDVDRLLASELVAIGTPEECWAAVMLWCRAWQQHPAASLPNDERVLAAFSRAGPRWKKVREVAMRGFVLCSDGRFYHPVLAVEVMAAWRKRNKYRDDQERLREWREEQRRKRDGNGHEAPDETDLKCVSGGGSETVSETVRERERQGEKERKKDSELRSAPAAPSRPPDARDALWREGVPIVRRLLGKGDRQSRSFLGDLLKGAHDDCARTLGILREADDLRPADPAAWLAAAARRNGSGPPSKLGHLVAAMGLGAPVPPTLDLEPSP